MDIDSRQEPEAPVVRRDIPAPPQLAFGVFLMIVGVLVGLERLGLGFVGAWWPLAIVIAGAIVFARATDRHGHVWGGAWMAVGAWLLLRNLGIIQVSFWRLLWPLILVAAGAALVRRTLHPPAAGTPRSPGTSTLVAFLGETNRTIDDPVFRDISMFAFMGGCNVDLRQTRIPAGETAVITTSSLLGGMEIVVPQGWLVTSEIVPILGNVDDKRLPPVVQVEGGEGGPPPRLRLQGFAVLGGVTIKN